MSNTPILPTTSKQLYDLLLQGVPTEPRDVDKSKIRYAIYARKSTTGDERQERSIPDQIRDCIDKVVKVDGLNVMGKPIEEKCSAKDPDIREKFRHLLDDVRSGKIDGIIAWHPDRLSRNMKEAGEIIDLLDKGVLKDLRFATSTFENSPTGKMLLGISFVLSKQYSEHLSESVTRGNRRKTEEGYFFDEQKHGYYTTGDRLYPDPDTFIIIKTAFLKRLEGMSQPEIAQWLNSQPYRVRKKGKDPQPYKWDKDSVSKMLKDPVYAGVLKYGKSFANLEEHYEFTPLVTVEEFFKINNIKDFTSPKIASAIMANKKETTKANLLRQIVWCGYCNKPFSSGLTSKELKAGKAYYYFYKCETDGCEFKGKSVRAKFILEYAYSFLDTHLFTTKRNYAAFLDDAKAYHAEHSKQLTSDILSLTNQVGKKKIEYENTKKLISANTALAKHYNLDETKSELDSLQQDLDKLITQREASKDALVTYKEYLELFQNVSVILRETHDITLLDQILRKFFSNFTVKSTGRGKEQRCNITHKLNEPWEGFVNNDNFDSGRG